MSSSSIGRQTLSPSKQALDTITVSLVGRQSRGDGASIEDQIAAMERKCEENGWLIGGRYEEHDVSGRRPLSKRPGLKRAVDDIEAGRSQVILTAYFDRFVRSVATRAEVVQRVEAAGGRVMSLDVGQTSDATAAEWLNGNMLAMFSEFYARQIGEKTVTSKQRNIDNGIAPFPRVTIAYEKIEDGPDKGKLRQHPVNGPLVREACKMRAKGASFRSIARWLNERIEGDRVSANGVERMMASRLLIGELHFGSFTPNLHAIEKPVIDRATFAKMQKTKSPRGRHAKSERLLARLGVLRCATCDYALIVHAKTVGEKKYAYYRCGNSLCEGRAMISAQYVEDLVRDRAIAESAAYEGHASNAVELEAARLAVVEIEEQLNGTIRSFASIPAAAQAAARETLAEITVEHDRAVAHHARLATLTATDLTITTARDWDKLTLDAKRGVIHATIARAVVTAAGGSHRGPSVVDGRVTIETR